MEHRRVVVTGLGVVAPNAIGVEDFTLALREGRSGIRFQQELKDLGFSCCIAGTPPVPDGMAERYLSRLQLRNFNSSGILYGCIAGIDAWKDAGLTVDPESPLDLDSGIVFGTGQSGSEKCREVIYNIDDLKVRSLGSNAVVQTMASGVSAYLAGILGAGNQVTTNSSACATGAEAVIMGYERIASGKAERMLVGSCSDHGPYIWGGFDAMRVMTYKHNESPEQGCRPLSATASGFVPGSGAGALLLESLESAQARGATIHAEVLGGAVNSGGQRDGGSMTAPNANAVKRCIQQAIASSGIGAADIDAINGHMTATIKDGLEIRNWTEALGRSGMDFPYINSLKGMIGHCLAASGSIECVSTVIELKEGFLFPSVNSEDLHAEVTELISADRIPQRALPMELEIIAKASFGFGDVNAVVIFKKWSA
ncbi:MAG: beta-ketoacyl-[acyl-carrier-protein] synthase family protein [Flavobacteriales bacterium]